MKPWLVDNKQYAWGDQLGYMCTRGHEFTCMNSVDAAKIQCPACMRPEAEIHAREWVEAKLHTKLQLHSQRGIYRARYNGEITYVAFGNQFVPVPEPKLLMPLDPALYEKAWQRFVA